MNTKPIEDFQKLLVAKGYKGHFKEETEEKRISGHDFWYVDIENGYDKVIQTFVLMQNYYRIKRNRYSIIWEQYNQRIDKNGLVVNPAAYIVTQVGEKWKIYPASNTINEIKKQDCILNYDLACKRFDKRVKNRKRWYLFALLLQWILWIIAIMLFLYLIIGVIRNISSGSEIFQWSGLLNLVWIIIILVIIPIVIKRLVVSGKNFNYKDLIKLIHEIK